MKALFSIALIMFSALNFALAENLTGEREFGDNERPAGVPKTVIIRVNEETQSLEMAEVDQIIADQNEVDVDSLAFVSMENSEDSYNGEFAELDQDSASDTWYFYFGFDAGVSYPFFNIYRPYYGYYNYQPYINWATGAWNYWTYRPRRFFRRFDRWLPYYRGNFYRRPVYRRPFWRRWWRW